jgi:hypothetical protein
MNYSLTDSDIREFVENDIPVMTYSELVDDGVLNVLLSSPSNACIFLVRQSETYGHWVLIWLKKEGNEKGLYIYDSYGNTPDSKEWKKYVSEDVLKSVHQEEPFLLKELYDSGFNIYYNEYKHQSNDKNVASCGRHCCVRSCFLDMDTDEYNNMITEGNLSPDKKVLELSKLILNK